MAREGNGVKRICLRMEEINSVCEWMRETEGKIDGLEERRENCYSCVLYARGDVL